MADAGRVAPIPKGDWSKSESYEQLDLVTYDNKLWIAKQPSINIVPADGDYWMLCLEDSSQEQFDDIIDGAITVGNANKLDGHGSDYYAKTDELFQIPRSYDSLDFDNIIESGLYSGLGSPLDVGCANYPVNATGLLIVFYHNAVPCQIYITYTCVMYFRARFSSLNWGEWKNTATTTDLANYLPLSGGTITGYILNMGSDSFEANSSLMFNLRNSKRRVANELNRNGYFYLYDYTNDKYIINSKPDGTTSINGTLATKPSGNYTGNGDVTQRLITVGGSGYALLIYSEKGAMWVSPKGAIGHNSSGAVQTLAYNKCCYYDENTLLIASDNSLVNQSGITYYYQVL